MTKITFISHGSEAEISKTEAPIDPMPAESLFAVYAYGRRDKRALWGLYYKSTIPLKELHPVDLITSPNPTSKYHHNGG